jgi:hypothetical protein
MRKLLVVFLFFFAICGVASAQQTCQGQGSASWRGLNINQISCDNWNGGFIPQSGEYYAALAFRFELKSRPPGARSTASIGAAVKRLFISADTDEITISVAPRLGSYISTERPIYSYMANNTERTFGTNADFEFSTPYIRYDNDPLTFVLKARATTKANFDVKALLDRVKPILDLAGGGVFSEATKPALDATAEITDSILTSYYSFEESSNATFGFAERSRDGVIKRILVLTSPQGDDEIGTLTATVKFRRSMIAGNDIGWNELTGGLPAPDYSNVNTNMLSIQMPAIGDQKNTLFSSLAADDDKRALLSKVAYGTGPIVESDCRQLRQTIFSTFGFNDIDTLRTIYELLEMGGRQDLYTLGSRTCFQGRDWNKLSDFKIIPDDLEVLPDKKLIDYFATGLRLGFKPNSIYLEQIAENLEQVEDNTGDSVLPCTGVNKSKTEVAACLDGFRLNRYSIASAEQSPITIVATRRSQILDALANIATEPPIVPASASNTGAQPNIPTTSMADAKAAAKIPDHVYRFLLFYDGNKKIRQITLEKSKRENVGSDLVEQLSFPCWIAAAGQNQSCADVAADQR